MIGFIAVFIFTFSCENNNLRTKNDSQDSNETTNKGNDSLIPSNSNSNPSIMPVNPVVPSSPTLIEQYCTKLNRPLA